MSEAFSYLSELQQRCQKNAAGLPENIDVADDWVGVGFSANDFRCVAKMSDVSEILPMPEVIRVPGVKSWVKGLANIRGLLMPILDLKGFVSGVDTQLDIKSRVLVVDKSGILAGLLVEEVFGLRRFKEGSQLQVESKETIDANMESYITGKFDEKQEHWSVFSVQKLLTTDQFIRVV